MRDEAPEFGPESEGPEGVGFTEGTEVPPVTEEDMRPAGHGDDAGRGFCQGTLGTDKCELFGGEHGSYLARGLTR